MATTPFQTEQNILATNPAPLTVYPEVELAFSTHPTPEMLTDLQQPTGADSVRASFQTASAFLQRQYKETSDLVLKALMKSRATKIKLASLDDTAQATSLEQIHNHYTTQAEENALSAHTSFEKLKALETELHPNDNGIVDLPCTFCKELESTTRAHDLEIIAALKTAADQLVSPEEKTLMQGFADKLHSDLLQSSESKSTRIANIKRLLTRAIHHKLTHLLPLLEEGETHHVAQLDYQLRLDRQIWLLRALMQQNILLREISIFRAIHQYFPKHHMYVKKCIELVKATAAPVFVKEMTQQSLKLEELTKKMVNLHEHIQQLKKQAVNTLVNIKTIDTRMPDYIAEMNALWAGLEYARQHTALSTSLKPRPIEGGI